MNIAENKGDVCENIKCKYCSNHGHLCRFGLRDIGCYIENDVVNEISIDFIKTLKDII